MTRDDEMMLAQVKAVKQWRLDVQASLEKRINGTSYTPSQRNVPILRYVENIDGSGYDMPKALLNEMKRIINSPDFEKVSKGWNRALIQVGPHALWEWLIMDKTTDFAELWSDKERAIVARAVANTYDRMHGQS
jgi:hypothetical protein